MENKKKIIIFSILLLLNNCSFDNKTGLWKDSEEEKRRVLELEQKQKEVIKVEKIYSSETKFEIEKTLNKEVVISEPKQVSSWRMPGQNLSNLLGNIYLPSIDNIFLKKKIGKDKFPNYKSVSPILTFEDNIIFSDDKGTIFNISKTGRIIWEKNIYKKLYKKINKSLTFSIYKKNLYVADNIGFIYSINLLNGKLTWIKNHGIPLRSNLKIFKDNIFLVDQDNKILCLKTNDGALVWDILSISSFIKSQKLMSLAISKDGNLFVITSSADIYKININSGGVIWSRNTATSMYANATDFFNSSEIVLTDHEIIFSTDFSTYSYDKYSGVTNWEAEVSSVSAPIVDGKNIFVVTENGYSVILEKKTGKIISSNSILKTLKKKKQRTKITSFIMGSGKIYSVTLNGFLIISSAESGKVEYFRKIGGTNISPIIISNGALYILTEKSKIIGFN